MEVVISLKDASIAGRENESGEMAARIRPVDLTPAPPACVKKISIEIEKDR